MGIAADSPLGLSWKRQPFPWARFDNGKLNAWFGRVCVPVLGSKPPCCRGGSRVIRREGHA